MGRSRHACGFSAGVGRLLCELHLFSTTAEAQTEATETTSTSDEISAIEADIEATDLESLDAELNAIDAEIEAALQ